jgi:hypothetical protein
MYQLLFLLLDITSNLTIDSTASDPMFVLVIFL